MESIDRPSFNIESLKIYFLIKRELVLLFTKNQFQRLKTKKLTYPYMYVMGPLHIAGSGKPIQIMAKRFL